MKYAFTLIFIIGISSTCYALDTYIPTYTENGGSINVKVQDPYRGMRTQTTVQQEKKIVIRGRRKRTGAVAASTKSAWGNMNLVVDEKLEVHDLLQVIIKQRVSAGTTTESEYGSESSLDSAITSWFKLQGLDLGTMLPQAKAAKSPSPDIKQSSKSSHKGDGEIKHDSTFDTVLTARIASVLPNGNYFIEGRYEVRMSAEISTFSFHGEVSPKDISSDRQISSDRVFDAFIDYSGRGAISDSNRRGFLMKLWMKVFRPF